MILRIIATLVLLTFVSSEDEHLKKMREEERSKVALPPCGACTALVTSFQAKLKSIDDFDQALAKTCSDVSRGGDQCSTNRQKWRLHLKEWWDSSDRPDIRDWLCVDRLEACCHDQHYGPQCDPCDRLGPNGKICSGNGKCKGAGTRKGNGECQCDSGYTGQACEKCSTSHYVSYEDGEKILCSPCHQSCNGDCTGAGPKKCLACRSGFVMDAIYGCKDIDECSANPKLCGTAGQYCVNLEGGHRCLNCDSACLMCNGPGPESCVECAEGYLRSGEDRVCVKDESGRILTINNVRFFTYGGLCVATAIIFQKSTIVSGVLGLIIAIYISITEYYLQNLDGDLQIQPSGTE